MNELKFPGIGDVDGKLFGVQVNIYDDDEERIITTGLIDSEIEQAIYISITNLRRISGFRLCYIHIHFPDYNCLKSGISSSLAIFVSLYIASQGIKLNKKYVLTGEIDLYGNIVGVGAIKEKTILFLKSNFDYFIVPQENFDEVNTIASSRNVCAVSTLSEVIDCIKEIESV